MGAGLPTRALRLWRHARETEHFVQARRQACERPCPQGQQHSDFQIARVHGFMSSDAPMVADSHIEIVSFWGISARFPPLAAGRPRVVSGREAFRRGKFSRAGSQSP